MFCLKKKVKIPNSPNPEGLQTLKCFIQAYYSKIPQGVNVCFVF